MAIDLKPFCLPSPNARLDLTEPWVLDGYEYASNGQMLVRRPTTEPNTKGRKLPKNPEEFFNKMPRDLAKLTFPKSQRVSVLCPECGKLVSVDEPVKIGDAWFNGTIVNLIAQLPNVRRSRPGVDCLLYFAADDNLQGVLHPIVTE